MHVNTQKKATNPQFAIQLPLHFFLTTHLKTRDSVLADHHLRTVLKLDHSALKAESYGTPKIVPGWQQISVK